MKDLKRNWDTINGVPLSLREQVPGYVLRRLADVENMEAALRAGDLPVIESTVHKIIGNAKGWGFSHLGDLAFSLRAALGESSQEERIASLLSDMRRDLEAVDITAIRRA